MRLTTLLVVAAIAAVGFAGCFGKTDSSSNDNGGSTNTTTPTTSATPSASPTPGGSTGGNGTGGPTTVTPKDIVSKKTHDFSQDLAAPVPGAPVGGATPDKFTVDAGYTKLTINISFAPAQGLPAAPNSASVKVGTYTCAANNPLTAAQACPAGSIAATPGPGQIEYSGGGPVVATITITES